MSIEAKRLPQEEDELEQDLEASTGTASSRKTWQRIAVASVLLNVACVAAMAWAVAPWRHHQEAAARVPEGVADSMQLQQRWPKGKRDRPPRVRDEDEEGPPSVNNSKSPAQYDLGRPPLVQQRGVLVHVDLTLTTCKVQTPWFNPSLFGPGGGSFYTRCYNGMLPGPTISANPGDTLVINFWNSLENPSPDCGRNANNGHPDDPDNFCLVNSTNLHTHGLHADPAEDNPLILIRPGQKLTYTIQIGNDHMPGTHWYHPHLHHSVAAQAGGGAHGLLIVRDPPHTLPPEVQDAQELPLVLSLVDLPALMRLESFSGGKLWRNSNQPKRRYRPDDDTEIESRVLVNGELEPTKQIAGGMWYRMRLLYASVEMTMEIYDGPGSAECEYQLIAKDGVYLMEMPRHLPAQKQAKPGTFHMAPGNRADIMMKCNCPPGILGCELNLAWRGRLVRPADGAGGGTIHIDATDYDEVSAYGAWGMFKAVKAQGTLLKLQVSGSFHQAPPIPNFIVIRPCYLVDLRKLHPRDIDPDAKKTLDMTVNDNGQFHLDWSPDTNGNGIWAGGRRPLNRWPMKTGKVYELRLLGADGHPFHLHTNPYQIIELEGQDHWTQPGDWHDVLMPYISEWAKVRFVAEKWAGVYVIHCHILEHEDAGMAGWLKIDLGKPTWNMAERIDASCFRAEAPNFGYYESG